MQAMTSEQGAQQLCAPIGAHLSLALQRRPHLQGSASVQQVLLPVYKLEFGSATIAQRKGQGGTLRCQTCALQGWNSLPHSRSLLCMSLHVQTEARGGAVLSAPGNAVVLCRKGRELAVLDSTRPAQLPRLARHKLRLHADW